MRKDLVETSRDTAARLLKYVEGEPNQNPNQMLALFDWQGVLHFGRMLYLYPEKPYIVYISKAPQRVSRETARALQALRKIPVYEVHPRVEFAGPKYLLGISGKSLCLLSGEDVLYCMIHPRDHTGEEYNTGQELIGLDKM